MSNSSLPTDASDQAPVSSPTLFKRLVNPLVIMLVLFGFPYIASWYFINSESSVSIGKLGNHGELVSPVVSLGEFSLHSTNGEILDEQSLAGNWVLFTITNGCEQVCQDTLLVIRQARKSTGVNRKVVKPVLLLQSADALKPFDVDLSEAFPQLSVISAESSGAQRLIEKFSEIHPSVENSVFMVDPYNNLMMYYPQGIQPKDLMEDLERLLKVNKPKL